MISTVEPKVDSFQEELCKLYIKRFSFFQKAAFDVLKSMTDAEDVVNSAVVKALRSSHSFDGKKASMTAWFGRIVKNQAIDELRKKKKKKDRMFNIFEGFDVAALEPELDYSEEVSLMFEILNSCPPDDVEFLKLMYFHGLSQLEISTVFNIPHGTAKSKINRALNKVRNAYIKHYEKQAAFQLNIEEVAEKIC